MIFITQETKTFPTFLRRRCHPKIYVPLPDLKARRKMIELFLKNIDASELSSYDVEELSIYTEGYTGGDILNICQDANTMFINEVKEGMHTDIKKAKEMFSGSCVSMSHLRYALRNRNSSVTEDQLADYQYFMDNYGARGLAALKDCAERKEASLQWQCRKCILENLNTDRLEAVPHLPVPRKLQLYILRRDRVEIEICNTDT